MMHSVPLFGQIWHGKYSRSPFERDIVELEHTLGVAVSLGLARIFMSSILGGGT